MFLEKSFSIKMKETIFSVHFLELLLLIYLSFSFVFKISLSTPSVLLLLLINLNFKKKLNSVPTQKTLNVVFALIYLLYFLSFLFIKLETDRNIIKSISFILIPLVFLYKTFSEKEIFYFIISFVVFQIIHIIYIDILMLKSIYVDNIIGFDKLNNLVENHFIIERPYFSLNCLLFIICLKYLFEAKKISFNSIFFLTIFVIISLFIIAARLAMFTSILLFFILISKKVKYNLKTFLLFFILIISFIFPFRKYAYERIFLKKGEPRLVIWNCATNISKEKNFNWLIGEFSNEVVLEKLIKCYNSKEVLVSEYSWIGKQNYNYNTHNQFISFFLSYGLVGFIFFFFIFVIHIYSYFHLSNIYSLLFVIVFSFQSFFENILDRQLGIYLFIWFSYLFIIKSKNIVIDE